MERITVETPSRWVDLRFIGTVALAIAAVWSTFIVTETYYSIKVKPEAKRTIRVTGSAKKRIVSDLIEWSATIRTHAPDRIAASKLLRVHTDRTVAFLKAQGIPEDEIQPQSADVSEDIEVTEEWKTLPGVEDPIRIEHRKSKGWIAAQGVFVRSTDVRRVEKASREVTVLLEEGIEIASHDPQYFYTRLGELKVEQLAAAGKDARARADNILRNTGGAGIKRVISADMGIININPANSTETSHEGNNDRSSLEKDIITIVHAHFELQ